MTLRVEPPRKGGARTSRVKLAAEVERLRRKLATLESRVETEVVRRVRRYQEETHRQLAPLYDRAPVGYLTLNGDGVIRTLNRTVTKLLKCQRSELIGRPLAELVTIPDRRRFLSHLRRLARHPGRAAAEVDLQWPGRPRLTVQFVTIAHTPQKGSPAEFQTIMVDVTPLKTVEEQLRRSEALYRAIGESIDYGVWVCAPDGRNLYASPSFLKLVGQTQEQCSNFGWGDVLHPDDAERTVAAWKECVRTGGAWDIEHRYRGVDGQYHAILARGVAVKDAQGVIQCWAGINLDISRLKQAEAERERLLAELSAEKSRWQATVDNLPEPVTVCDADGQVTYMNSAYERLIGRPVLAGLDLEYHPEYYQLYRADGTLFAPEDLPLQKAARTGQEVRQVEIVQRSAQGREFVALFNAAPLRDVDGRVTGAVAAGRDITQQRRAEQVLRDFTAQLEQRVAAQTAEIRQASGLLARRVDDLARANAELEAFTYSVSHDLRAPLRQVIGFVTQLEECAAGTLAPEGAECVRLIRTAVSRMGKLIDDLLAFSRMGRVEVLQERVSLRSLLDQAREVLQPAVAGRTVEWRIGPLPEVRGDPALLRQVFVCLLDNALKFTRSREGVRVEVGSLANAAEHVVFVRDNGVGFNQHYAGKLFGVFQRLHGVGEFEGTGIGLANVHRIIHRHLGRVWAEGVEGQGATFYFSLPLDTPVAESARS